MDFGALREAIRTGRISWQRHALERMAERGILRDEVKEAILKGLVIEDYPTDYPFPSALLLGGPKKRPLHVVASVDESNGEAFIITVYEPGLDRFEADLRTRRKK